MFPFEKLEVYKRAFSANQKTYAFLKSDSKIPAYLKNQFGRASLSIMLNLAEGSGRLTNRDRRNFLINARGSLFECVAIVDFLLNQHDIPVILHSDLKADYDEISRMLYAMIKNISKEL